MNFRIRQEPSVSARLLKVLQLIKVLYAYIKCDRDSYTTEFGGEFRFGGRIYAKDKEVGMHSP
jgi:hypothetical protein